MNQAELAEVLALHKKWLIDHDDGRRANLRDADLRGANLRGANLRDANLRDAYLGGAYLGGAYLGGADLGGANLRDANLRGANLGGADLGDADLRGANLRGANLRDANLRDADLGDVLWEAYLADVVPALLTAGGKTLAEVATPETWACHSWRGDGIACPIATAFDCASLAGVPALYRQQAERFIRFFDNGLVPLPALVTPTDSPTKEPR